MNLDSLYATCMSGERAFTAGDVSKALETPFALYCKYHEDESKQNPPDPYVEKLMERGNMHEKAVLESMFPDSVSVTSDDRADGFREALDYMKNGIKTIAQVPLFWLPDGLYGVADVLVRADGKSVFGPYHYEAIEIKSAKDIKNKHITQAAFYNYVLGMIQEFAPEHFWIINKEYEQKLYAWGERKGMLEENLNNAAKIRDGFRPPAIYSNASKSEWSDYEKQSAIDADDMTLVPGLGASKRETLLDNGFRTIHDIAASNEYDLKQVKGIAEKTAQKYLCSAQAITSGEIIKKAPLVLPEHATEIFLDFEGLGDEAEEDIDIYLIGALVRKDGKEEFKKFVAEDKDESQMLRDFINFLKEQNDYVMYHWAHYEKTFFKTLEKRHGFSDKEHDMIFSHLHDLRATAAKSFAFPLYSDSIKPVAKWMGFEWGQDDVNATMSIGMYLDYIDDPVANKELLNKVILYNRNDCEATRVVKDWMVEHSGQS